MNLKMVGTILALACIAGMAYADDDDHDHGRDADNCVDQCVDQCRDGHGWDSNWDRLSCGRQCVAACHKDIAKPQHVFDGPVISTPNCTTNSDSRTICTFSVHGTVANNAYCPGSVTFYAICPAGTPFCANSDSDCLFTIGRATTNADCTFTTTLPDTFNGQNGCYGTVAATPAPTNNLQAPINGQGPDPAWGGCTGNGCPSP
ncbi:MAG TPA: hypothetical protein VLW85_04660 [Myxococcales bacterium]|nr:hypothetical protein [Myxococcales bacterium]